MRLKLSIARFEVSVPELKLAVEGFAQNRIKALESVVEDGRRVIADFLNQAMHAEMTLFLGKPNEADNKRNGYEERDYTFKGLGTLRVKVPVDRGRRFNSVIIPKNERMDPRLSEDMAALHLAGDSTRTLALMSKRMLGIEVSHQTVSSSLDIPLSRVLRGATTISIKPCNTGSMIISTLRHLRRNPWTALPDPSAEFAFRSLCRQSINFFHCFMPRSRGRGHGYGI